MSEYTLDFIDRNPIAIQHEIKELEAEVERLQSKVDDYEYPLRTTRKITVLQEVWDEREKRRKELEAEVKRLREAVTALAKIAPQNNARAAILAALEEQGDDK